MTYGLPRSARFAAAATLLALAAAAQRRAPQIVDGHYFVTSWDTRNGLPQNTVNELLETDDGMVWAATFGGVGRFSGFEWQVFDTGSLPGLADARVTAMAVGSAGEIWLGGEKGAVGRLVGDRFEQIVTLGTRPVRSILVRDDGSLLCTNFADIWVVRPGQPAQRRYPSPLTGVLWLRGMADGSIWGGGERLWRLDDPAPIAFGDAPCSDATLTADGILWTTAAGGLSRIDRDRRTSLVWGGGPARSLLVAQDGSIWFTSAGQVWRLVVGEQPQLMHDAGEVVHRVLQSRDGSIWLGTFGAGLQRLCARDLSVQRLAGRNRFEPATCVTHDRRGGVWVGSQDGLFHGEPERLQLVPATAGLAVNALQAEDDGGILIGLRGRVMRVVDGVLTASWPVPGLVRAILSQPGDRSLYVGTEGGLLRLAIDGGGPPEIVTGSECLRGSSVKMIVPDGDGGLWVAAESGLLRLPADAPPLWLRRGIELPAAEVRAVLRTPAGRDWCVTYGAGLVALPPGSLPTIGAAEGLPDPFLCSAVAVGGRWLIGCNHGALLVDPAELDAVRSGEQPWLCCRALLGEAGPDGEANGGNQPSASVFGSTAAMSAIGGVWMVDLARLSPVPPPPVCLAEVVGESRAGLQADGSLVVPASAARTIVVRLTGPRFDAPELVRFRWRLDGGPWSHPSTERTVSFTLSGPGDYEFAAEALGFERRAHPLPATISVRVEPRPWERVWFPVAIAAIGVLIGGAIYGFGSRRAARRARWLEAVVAERTTELREIRDGLELRVGERTHELRQAMARLEEEHRRGIELEAELSRARRFEGLGLLAGGVAHDFNNLLTAVLGNVELLEHKLVGRGELLDLACRVREAGIRGRDLTRRLLAIASQQLVDTVPIDLGAVLDGMQGAMTQLLGDEIGLDVRCVRPLPPIRAARSQVEQILSHLCENAREAMPAGGKVTVLVEAAHDQVRLVFTDDGVGMTDEVRERAFEPFFTSRSFEQAQGLGLATVQGITRQLGGTVRLDTEPGHGARFEFRFPAATAEKQVVVPRVESLPNTASQPPQRLRVLLVDDEAAVRIALRRMMQLCDFEIVADAEHGDRALQLLEDPSLEVDVVLCDVRMPGVSGAALVEEMRRRRPALPVVFLTGFAWGGGDLEELRRHGVELLVKPPERDELFAALNRAVGCGA